MTTRRDQRILTMQALYCWEITREKPETLLAFSWLSDKRKSNDYDYAIALVHAAIEHEKHIDRIIMQTLSHWDIERLAKTDLAIIRMAMSELLYTDIPALITIDEAIEIAKLYSGDDSPGFINGILDAVAKEYKKEPAIAEKSNDSLEE